METTLGELILLLAVLFGLYRLLRPVQRWLEDLLLRTLDPRRRHTIDVKDYEVRKEKPPKE